MAKINDLEVGVISLKRSSWILLLAIAVMSYFVIASFSFWMGQKIQCMHNIPFEVPLTGGTRMLIVPDGWYGVPVHGEHKSRNYIKPTDQ